MRSCISSVGKKPLLFLVGVVLVIVEIFFVPGLGVPGVLGLIFVIAALVLALIGIPIDVSFETGVLADAMTRVLLSLLGSFVLALVFMRLLSKTAMGKNFVLEDAETGFLSAPSASDLVGQIGEAQTDLRPAGKIVIEGQRYEATSEREFIAHGSRVRVIGKDGPGSRRPPRGGGVTAAIIVVVLVIGLLLLFAEVAIVPGFGVAGALGLLALAAGAIAAWTELGPLWGGVTSGALRSSLLESCSSGCQEADSVGKWSSSTARRTPSRRRIGVALVGRRGTTVTPLRPIGRIRIGSEEVDVMTEGEYIDSNLEVEVVSVEGPRVIVRIPDTR